ncbi:MAG: proteasome accessory factor PafA2 [Actinobacteria bacterium]|nr:MAG: proteasome accessory factor PafA2 [Actinomycetota bacterium]
MSVDRVIGTETEYGIYRPGDVSANPVALSTEVVAAYARRSRRGTPAEASAPVRWDYSGEDPLNDLRGYRMDRGSADPSFLTDNPYHLAPSAGTHFIPRPLSEDEPGTMPTAVVLPNGARLYVDHAHPEYSAPEARGPRDAVLWDRAGEVIAQRMMDEVLAYSGEHVVLVKNNTDGKGAAYGTHENYQVARKVDLDDIIRGLIPFMVTRPVTCGAGRVGRGQHSESPGFQISQRADFVENDVGLETTFHRPIINTRDEPHADPASYRRFHVIGGDGNMFDYSAFIRFGSTSLVLWAIEAGIGLEWEALTLSDPVRETWAVSHHPDLDYRLTTAGGHSYTAAEIQQMYLDLVLATYQRLGITPDPAAQEVLDVWQSVLDRIRHDLFSVATEVEWVAKYQLLLRQRERLSLQWDDPRLAALDLQWSDLRPEHSLTARLDAAGRIRRLFSPEQVEAAADHAPRDTRAYLRGMAVSHLPQLVKASWTSLVIDEPHHSALVRIPLHQADTVDSELARLIENGKIIS